MIWTGRAAGADAQGLVNCTHTNANRRVTTEINGRSVIRLHP